MLQECLNTHIVNIKCKAASLAASWSDKVKLGKWCDEQEQALIFADWALDILCSHKGCIPDTIQSVFSGIFYPFVTTDLLNGETISFYANGNLLYTQDVTTSNLDGNWNVMELMRKVATSITFNNDTTAFEGSLSGFAYTQFPTINESASDIPTWYNMICDCSITDISIEFTLEPVYNGSLPNTVIGNCNTGVEVCYTNCFTEDEICKLIEKTYKVINYKCNCC